MTLRLKSANLLTYATFFVAMLLICVAVSCGETKKDNEKNVSETDAVLSSDVSSEEPVDVSLSDISLELGYGITRKIDAVGGAEIKWSTSDEKIASVDNDGNIKGVDLGECVITATNEFGRSAQCAVAVKNTCYLSFDDGPLANVDALLDALKETNVKGTFFLVDSIYLPNAVKRMHDEGHTLALHTKKNSTKHCYSDMYIYYTDLDLLNDHIEQYTGVRSNILRFPGGTSNHSSDPLTMRRIVNGANDLGYRVFDWTLSAEDAVFGASLENSYMLIMYYCNKKQEIILMHDKDYTPQLVRKIVPLLKERGYVFETLDHYPEQSYTFTCRYSQMYNDVPAESVSMKSETAEVKVNDTIRLSATTVPKKSTDFIVWQSSDESIAKVDKGGTVTGIAPGEAEITAKTTSGKTTTCKVIVLPAE